MAIREITPGLVRELLADQFPEWSALPVKPVAWGGWDNRTMWLGDELLVRLPSDDCYAPPVQKEQRWLPVLAPQLPLAIPTPVARGRPGCGFPLSWSVYRWLAGEPLTKENVRDTVSLAVDLGEFLVALRSVDATAAPRPGAENFYRGGDLATYDAEARTAIARLGGVTDAKAALDIWEAALASSWLPAPVWIHGDMAPTNLLVREGKLSAVIDFGCAAAGDPACDLVIAWTFFSGESRAAFTQAVDLDSDTWARARGWMLWKAAITLADALNASPLDGDQAGLRFGWRSSARIVIDDVLREHA